MKFSVLHRLSRKIELRRFCNDAHDAFKKRKDAFENQYIRKQTAEQLEELKAKIQEKRKEKLKDELKKVRENLDDNEKSK
ncbi:unnamed protein product [Phaedon cochleariae]|uniref:Uncharacterized protein n=1 Tax=Phaedon cochleariae TaxID=80249 RepID=A0A9P0GUN2_PHACE|nr:unnamed protein product [Phaedon cochleariae]